MSCKYVEGQKCLIHPDDPTLPQCEFCLRARTQWITQLNPIQKDHGRLYEELNRLRREKEAWEAQPR